MEAVAINLRTMVEEHPAQSALRAASANCETESFRAT